ncbi:AMP-binding protein [bacterium]|nr:AMP-binding protein [bacterium]
MSKERKERRRKILLKKQLLSDRRQMEKFLSDKMSFNKYFKESISQYSNIPAVTDTYNDLEMNYSEFEGQISLVASALQSFGVKRGDFVGIFTENNGRWAVCEQAVMRCGAIATLRGSTCPVGELDYIMGHSDAVGIFVRDGHLLTKLKPYLKNHALNFVIIMFKGAKDDLSGIDAPVMYFDDVLEKGKNYTFKEPEQSLDDYAVMMYTSGTTGNPKGVLLTHKNILSQMPALQRGVKSKKGENTLQILPVWHAYEHTTQLYFFTCGCHLHFTTLKDLKNDLVKYKIDMMMSVPRIWEAIRLGVFQKLKQTSHFKYRIFDFGVKLSIKYKIHKMYSERRITNKKHAYHFYMNWYHRFVRLFMKPIHVLLTHTIYRAVKNAIGLNFRMSVSGGSSLALKDQLFYDAIGVNLREGYGLTETSPIITLRDADKMNYLGSCGQPFMATEIKVFDIETDEELGVFQKGVVKARGYQIMHGYYKDQAATDAVIDKDGWFTTGDIGWMTYDNNLVLVGRMKETIVLSNGENVEPVPLEEACLESPYIGQIMLVGQDESSLGALVVPSEAALEKCGILANDLKSGKNLTIKDQTLRDLIKREIATYIKNKQNFKNFEQVKQFEVLNEDFNMNNGMLSQTAKIKRNNIFEKYKATISEMFDKK